MAAEDREPAPDESLKKGIRIEGSPEQVSEELRKRAEGASPKFAGVVERPGIDQSSEVPKSAEDDVDYANQLTPDRSVGDIPDHHEEIVIPAREPQGSDAVDLETYRQQIAAKEAPRVVELPKKESVSMPIGSEEAFKNYANRVDSANRQERQERAEKISWFDKWFLGKKPPRNES